VVISNKDILDAVNRVSDQVTRVDEKADRTNVRLDTVVWRMDTLVETTNHRMDDFTDALTLKQDKNSLLTSLGFTLMETRVVRWSIGAAFAAAISTVAVQHWWGEILHLFGV
jgi:hypothetical protein